MNYDYWYFGKNDPLKKIMINLNTLNFAIISVVYPVVEPIFTPNLFRSTLIVSGVPERIEKNMYIM